MEVGNITFYRYAPIKYSTEENEVIESLDYLDDEFETEELLELYQKHTDIPEVIAHKVNLYSYSDEDEVAMKFLEDGLTDFPESIHLKMIYSKKHLEPFDTSDKVAAFEKLFRKEIEIFIQGASTDQFFSDNEIRILFLMLVDFYVMTNHKEIAEQVYLMSDNMPFAELSTTLAFKIREEEQGMPFGGIGEFMAVQDWARVCYYSIHNDHKTNILPDNKIFFELLNANIEAFSEEFIVQLDKLTVDESFIHDVFWLLKAGVYRATQVGEDMSMDFYLNVLYLSVEKNMTQVFPHLLNCLVGMPESIYDRLVGDFGNLFLMPSLAKIALHDLSFFKEVLTFQDEEELEPFCTLKADVLAAVSHVASNKGPAQPKAIELLHDLWAIYLKRDNEMLSWLMYSIATYSVSGFNEKIEQAFEKDLIDLSILGGYKQYLEYFESNDDSFALKTHQSLKECYQVHWQMAENFNQKKGQYSVDDKINAALQLYNRNLNKELEMDEFGGEYFGFDDDFDDDEDFGEHLNFLEKSKPVRSHKIGRNQPCPCGSGKKYKKCCLLTSKG